MPAPKSQNSKKNGSRDRRRVALVTTTINVPHCLENYLENIEQHGYGDQTLLVVVGDLKTPPATAEFLAGLDKRFPTEVVYLDVDDQKKMLRRWPSFDLFLRYNCIQRRNVGYLEAKLREAQVIVALDDDNFVTDEDYLGAHLVVGKIAQVPVLRHASGWWNICERLRCEPARKFYHRGYPKSLQSFAQGGYEVETKSVRPVVNAGLWLKNPDVDATANIEEPLNVVSMDPISGSRSVALAKGTWCPFNSQNTAFEASTLAAMYLVVMLDTFRGYRIGRLDDIWMSYFLRVIADQLGETVVYGPPLVVQDRNPHNFVRDLSEELGGYILTETLVRYLREFKTEESSYTSAYLDLIYHLQSSYERDSAIDESIREYFRVMVVGMAAWHSAVMEIG